MSCHSTKPQDGNRLVNAEWLAGFDNRCSANRPIFGKQYFADPGTVLVG